MKVLRCLLSIFLCSSLFFSNVIGFIASAANGNSKPNVNYDEPNPNFMDDPCPFDKRNKIGNYIEPLCAKKFVIRELRKALENKKEVPMQEKSLGVGPEAQHEVHMFTLNAMALFVEDMAMLFESAKRRALNHKILESAVDRVKFLFGFDTEDAETVVSELYERFTGETIPIPMKGGYTTPQNKFTGSVKAWAAAAGVVGLIVGTTAVAFFCGPAGAAVAFTAKIAGGVKAAGATKLVIGAVTGGLGGGELGGYFRATQIRDEQEKEKEIQATKLENTVSAFSQMLAALKWSFWKAADSVSVIFNNAPSYASATVSFENIGLNYSSTERQEIERQFESAKIDMQKIINEYDKMRERGDLL